MGRNHHLAIILALLAPLGLGCEVTTGSDGGTDTGTGTDTGGGTDTGTGTDTGGGTDTGAPGCDLAAGEERRVGSSTAGGRFSPGSDAIVTVVFEGFSANGLEVLDLCGDSVSEIATGDSPQPYIAWSSDGTTLYYARRDGVSSVPAAGGTPAAVVEGPRAMDLSPDGSTLVYSDSGDLFLYEIATSTATDLEQQGTFPRFNADGTMVAFVEGGMLRVWDIAAGTASDVSAIDNAAFQPFDWFSDGTFAVVTDAGIDRIDASGAVIATLTTGEVRQDVDVSPDDTMLAYRINGTLPTILLGL